MSIRVSIPMCRERTTTSARKPKTTVSSSGVVNARYRSYSYQYKNRKRRDTTAEGRIADEDANEVTQNNARKTIGNSVRVIGDGGRDVA